MRKYLFIIGTECKWEEEELKKAAKKKNLSAQILKVKDINIQLNTSEGILFYQGKNITKKFKESYVIFRRTRGKPDKMISLALLAQHWQVPFTDSVISIMGNLNKMISMSAINTKRIKQVPTAFLGKKEQFDPKKNNFPLPLLTKPTQGRHGEGIKIFKTTRSLNKFLKQNNSEILLQPFLNIEEEYRIFVVGNKSLGATKKIPAKGSKIANYAAGAQFLPTKIDPAIEKEAIKICQQQEIEIGGVDLAKTKNKFHLLEINRCPEFKAFSKAKKIDVAEKIIKLILTK